MNEIVLWRKKLLSPVENSDWASEMVLNPAIIEDPKTKRIHMIFRATGPYPQAKVEGDPRMPYPIFLGYAYSDDGENFTFDLEKPVLAPALKYDKENIYITNHKGEKVPDFTNGCLEDPRLFFIDDECYMTAACRMFPPGAYWAKGYTGHILPDWAKYEDQNPFGTHENPTVTVLYKVDLDELSSQNYEKAFTYICPLNDPKYGEDRDVVFFSKKMMVDGKLCYIMLQRPVTPDTYPEFTATTPSIVISAAQSFEDFAANNNVKRRLVLSPTEDWQKERVGASVPPLEIGEGRWLLNYHGKKDRYEGYGQSFMIFKEVENDMPVVEKLSPEKMIGCAEEFEMPARFAIPCIFFTGMIFHKGDLLVSYGAADERVGLLKIDYKKLMEKMGEL